MKSLSHKSTKNEGNGAEEIICYDRNVKMWTLLAKRRSDVLNGAITRYCLDVVSRLRSASNTIRTLPALGLGVVPL